MTDGLTYVDEERVYADGLTQMGQSGRRFVGSGCVVTAQVTPDMTVNVSTGTVYFDGELVGVDSEANLTISPANPTLNRFDLVVADENGDVSVLVGTAKSESDGFGPTPPAYDADDYVVLARISVTNGATSITSTDIKDMRIINTGGAGTGGGIGKYNINLDNATTGVILHNLNDSVPLVEVWEQDDPTIRVIPSVIEVIDDNSLRVDFTSAVDVRVAVHGGVFNQVNVTQARDEVTVTNSTSNIYTHSFAVKPVVQFIDEYGIVKTSGFTVDHVSNNTVQVDFDSSTSGTIVYVGGAFGTLKSTRRYQMQMVQSDLTYSPAPGQIGNTPTIDMKAGQTSGVLFDFVPGFDTDDSEDINLEMQYCMSDSTSGTVTMQLDINKYDVTDGVTSTIQTSLVEVITVPTTALEFDAHTFSDIKIPASYVSTSEIICLELFRSDSDANAGDLRIMNLDLINKTR